MVDKITKEQLEDLEDARFFDLNEFHELLEEYTGIKAEPYTGFSYYDAAGSYIGDYEDEIRELLSHAYIKVADNAKDGADNG